MKTPRLGLLLVLLAARVAAAEPVGSDYLRDMPVAAPAFGAKSADCYPYDGVRMQRWRRESPEVNWLVVWIDLRTPGLGIRISETRLSPGPTGAPIPSASAHNIRDFMDGNPDVQLAVNTVAYWPFPAVKGMTVHLSEPVWKGDDNAHDPRAGTFMLGLSPGKAVLGEPAEVRAERPEVAFGSFFDTNEETPEQSILVRRGQAQTKPVAPHARTLAGVRDGGRVLILVIADGYNPGTSIGLTYEDGAEILLAAGATDGIALDGGGSSALACRQADGAAVIVNRPAGQSNKPGTLRYVAAHVGFTGLRRTEEPLPADPEAEAGWLTLAWWRAVTWVRVHPWVTGGSVAGVILMVVLIWLWRRRARRLTPLALGTPGERGRG